MNVDQYRYTLTRGFTVGLRAPLVFCMLNPSTADETQDDPTIRRCIGFAKRENACGIIVVNLYAMRATKPAALLVCRDPVGPANDSILQRIAKADGDTPREIICAWGAHAAANYRAKQVTKLFTDAGATLRCLGMTAQGAPRHPLYVRGDQPLVPYGS